MGNVVAIVILPLLIGCVVTWLLSRYYYHRSSDDITRLVKRFGIDAQSVARKDPKVHAQNVEPSEPTQAMPNQDSGPVRAATRLLLEILNAFEKNEISWAELLLAVRTMQQAGYMASESIARITRAPLLKAMPTTPQYNEILDETRRIEISKLRRALEEQLGK